MNISSIVVRTLPEHLDKVQEGLVASGLCEIHFTDDQGRIVATVEGDDNADESAKLKQIMKIPNVVSAEFAYTYTDPDARAEPEAPEAGK